MLVLFITGLLLRLTSVQGGPSLSSLYQPEVPNRHLNLAPIDQRLSNDVTQPFDGISPRFWFGQGYRQAYKQMLQMYNDQLLTEKGTDSSSRDLNVNGGNPYKTEEQAIFDSVTKERIPTLSSDEQSTMDKRDSPISMCYFKLCNLGRKRRISQGGNLGGLIASNAFKGE